MKTRKTSNRITFQSLTAAVCVCALLLGLTPTAAAAETQSAETSAAESSGVTTAEATGVSPEASAEEDLLTYLRGEIAAYMETYQLTADMPDQALQNAYLTLNSKASKAAWDTANELLSLAQGLSAEDAEILLADISTKLCLRFYDVMEEIVKSVPISISVSGDDNLPEGLSATESSGSLAWSISSDKKITVSATTGESGCPTTYTPATGTLTLTTSGAATLNVTVGISGNGTVELNGESVTNNSSKVYTLQENGTLTIKVTSAESSDITTLTLSYQYVPKGDSVTISFQPVASIPYTVNSSNAVNADAVDVTGDPADGFEIKASSTNYVLSGATLVTEDGTTTTLTAIAGKVSPTVSGKLTPIFAYDSDGDGNAPYLVGSTIYWDWDEAMTAAASGDKLVILNDDHTLAAGDYTIPSGVTLLIPFDDGNTLITDNMGDHVNENYSSPPDPELYRQLTMDSGAEITVNGALCVGSRALNLVRGQVGPYGSIVMDEGSNITIKSGANLYAYGYIFYGEGDGGNVTVEGGTVYETAFCMDYPGNISNADDLLDPEKGGVFPLRNITVRNVEVPMTLGSAATEKIFFCFYGTTLGGNLPGYIDFIGNTTGSTFCLNSGASITKSYFDGRQQYVCNGSVSLNPLNIDLSLLVFSYTANSSTTSGFPIGSSYDIEIASGTLTLNDNVVCYEGSNLTISETATVDTNGKSVYILDADDDPGAMWVDGESTSVLDASVDVHGTKYGRVETDAVWEVNGTLKVSGGLYTSAGKASIISTGNGEIVFDGASGADTTVSIRYGRGYINEGNAGYKSLDVTSAYLQNADGTFVETAGNTEATTYYYSKEHGRWDRGHNHVDTPTTVDATCLTGGYTIHTCSCGYVYADTFTALGDHTMVDGVCSVCGYTDGTALFQIDYVSLSMENSLEMNFAFLQSHIGDTGTYEVRFIRLNPDGTTRKAYSVPQSEWKSATISGNKYYYASYTGLAAKEMTDMLYVAVYKDDARVSEVKQDSIQNQAMRNLQLTTSDFTRTMVVDMLNYGAAAQQKFSYQLHNLANSQLSDDQKKWATPSVEYEDKSTVTEGVTYQANVKLESNIQFIIGLGGIENATTVDITFYDHYGQDKSILNIPWGNFTKSGSLYTYIIDKTVIADAWKDITITVKNGDTVVATITDNIASYAARATSKTGNELYEMIVKFSYSAKEYLHDKYGIVEG